MEQKVSLLQHCCITVNTKFNDTIYDLDVHCYHGKPYIVEKLGDVRYKIGLQIFFQTNSEGAKILFDYVAEYADFKGDENVYDLYTGTGSIALYIAHKVARVTARKKYREAIADANENCRFFPDLKVLCREMSNYPTMTLASMD